MRILIQNRHPCIWIGGDQIQLQATQVALMEMGVEADFSPEIEPVLDGYDLVHLFNLPAPWTYLQCLNAQRQAKRVIVSAIYQETEKTVPYWAQQQIVDCASKVICLAPGELDRMRRHLTVDDSKVAIVPNGVDQTFRGDGVEPFELGDGKDYALCVGRINDKNQLLLAEVCRELGVPLVLVGEMRAPRFVTELADVGHPELVHLGPRAQSDLIPIYKGAKVVVCASPAEVFPSVVMEGGLAGCNIVLTKGSASMTDWPNVEVCDPNHPESIGAAIAKQMAKPQDNQLVERVMDHTWERTGERVRTAYEQALAIPQGTPEKSLLPEPPSSTLRLFSESQREETLFLAFLLPAWRQLENGDVSSARQNLEGFFRFGNDRAFLSELLVRSAADHAAQLATGSSTNATSIEFTDNLLSAVSPPPELKSQARGELYAQMAFSMLATGQKRRATRLALRSFIHDRNILIPLRLFTIGLERALGLQLSGPYGSAKALMLPLCRGSDRDPEVGPR